MQVIKLYNADGSLADIEATIKAIPNRVMRQIDTVAGTCTVYQVGDELPGLSAEKQLASAKNMALEKLREYKWQVKNSGITVDGIKINTDSTGQETISGAVLNCLINSQYTARWKTSDVNPDGSAIWITINSEIIYNLAAALTHYTEACFAVEEQKQIQLGKLNSVDSIQKWVENDLTTDWPVQVYTL